METEISGFSKIVREERGAWGLVFKFMVNISFFREFISWFGEAGFVRGKVDMKEGFV